MVAVVDDDASGVVVAVVTEGGTVEVSVADVGGEEVFATPAMELDVEGETAEGAVASGG